MATSRSRASDEFDDYANNYTVVMPPTPDNQPAGAGDKPDGPTVFRAPSSRFRSESQPPGKLDRRMSILNNNNNNNKSMLLRSQTQDFDHNRWLFETKGKYGIGNAFWQDDDSFDHDTGMSMQDFMDKPWKPLTRKVRVPGGVISPYRVLIVFRMIALALFLAWRVQNPNRDAMWLWGISIVCEIWFAFSWLLDILPKFNPINRAADLSALKDKFETPSSSNPTGRSDLPGMDVFISTADPEKEPPLVTANTILSILAVDYPIEKLSVYISDDGGAILTFEAMAEAVKFAEIWVPFCRKHDIEPRNPDSYFSQKTDPTKNKKRPDFVKDRRWIKREYDEFKVRINGLPDVIRKRCKMYNKNEELQEQKLVREKNNGVLPTDHKSQVTKATWMADGTNWPGTCWSCDSGNMRALDGLQGPVYVGTGCMFRRYALYGFPPPRANEYSGWIGQNKTPAKTIKPSQQEDEEPLTASHPDLDLPKKFGNSTMFTDSITVAEFQGRPLADHFSVKNGRPPGALLVPRPPLDAPTAAEAIAVISCWYEDNTEWGDRVGWIYGSVTEDVVTGYRMHNRGWRSVYCITRRDAFRGTAPINLTDRLHQVLRWATGSVEIFFSRNNALLATPRLKFLQRIAYLNVGIYPFTSIFLVVYCFLPALSLFTGQFIVQSLDISFLLYLLIITLCLVCISLLEVKWSGIGLEEWWRNEQFWVIGGTSAHLVAVLQGLLKVVAGIEISFTLTSKSAGEDVDDVYADLYIVKWTGLFVVPLTIIIVNLVALVIGFARTVYSVIPEWSKLLGGAFFSFWVLAHMYPFAKGLMGRKGKLPTIIYVWSGLISITVSLLWIVISPPGGAKPGDGGGEVKF
ncbi:cellulose synthase family protein [Striga asiatica]|uniref:Cellulose synthase family protein n=1 Tax=Striga asiatica TaxID=4170 RepID=A0A5A7QXD2_STRAF|nr:cellulose synthase family protein [Striga asiatica]